MPLNSYIELWFRTNLKCCTRCPKKVCKYLNKQKNKYEVDQFYLIIDEGKIYVEGHYDSQTMKKKLSRKLCEHVWIQPVQWSPQRTVNRPVPVAYELTPPKVKKPMKRTSSDDEEDNDSNDNATYYGGSSSHAEGSTYNYNEVAFNYGLDREGESYNYARDDGVPFSRLGLTVGRGTSTSSYNNFEASGEDRSNLDSVSSNYNRNDTRHGWFW